MTFVYDCYHKPVSDIYFSSNKTISFNTPDIVDFNINTVLK